MQYSTGTSTTSAQQKGVFSVWVKKSAHNGFGEEDVWVDCSEDEGSDHEVDLPLVDCQDKLYVSRAFCEF
jgi:hypothetical protein